MGKWGPWTLPSGYVKIAIENDHRNSGFSHETWWIFPVRYVSHYQRENDQSPAKALPGGDDLSHHGPDGKPQVQVPPF